MTEVRYLSATACTNAALLVFILYQNEQRNDKMILRPRMALQEVPI